MTKKNELKFKTYTEKCRSLKKHRLETYKTRRLILNKFPDRRKYDLRFSVRRFCVDFIGLILSQIFRVPSYTRDICHWKDCDRLLSCVLRISYRLKISVPVEPIVNLENRNSLRILDLIFWFWKRDTGVHSFCCNIDEAEEFLFFNLKCGLLRTVWTFERIEFLHRAAKLAWAKIEETSCVIPGSDDTKHR